MIDTSACPEQFPFRIERTDLNTGVTTSESVKTSEEALKAVTTADSENWFVSAWNRLLGECIGDNGPEDLAAIKFEPASKPYDGPNDPPSYVRHDVTNEELLEAYKRGGEVNAFPPR